jgi:CheY-like chemotaxis protein
MLLAAHTIKGSAAMVTLNDAAALAHAIEDVLVYLRDEQRELDRETADVLFQGLDLLRALVRAGRTNPSAPDPAGTSLAMALRDRIQAGSAVATTAGAQAPATTETSAQPTEARRILLVEDSTTVRMLVTKQLSDAGYVVEARNDGELALATALAGTFNLVIASSQTRSLGGLDLAAALRAAPAYRDVPIILLSSDERPEHRQRADEIGVQAFVRKGSADQRRLVETVRELLA